MKRYNKGFTVVELMIAVMIFSLLAAVIIPQFVNYNIRNTAQEMILRDISIETVKEVRVAKKMLEIIDTAKDNINYKVPISTVNDEAVKHIMREINMTLEEYMKSELKSDSSNDDKEEVSLDIEPSQNESGLVCDEPENFFSVYTTTIYDKSLDRRYIFKYTCEEGSEDKKNINCEPY